MYRRSGLIDAIASERICALSRADDPTSQSSITKYEGRLRDEFLKDLPQVVLCDDVEPEAPRVIMERLCPQDEATGELAVPFIVDERTGAFEPWSVDLWQEEFPSARPPFRRMIIETPQGIAAEIEEGVDPLSFTIEGWQRCSDGRWGKLLGFARFRVSAHGAIERVWFSGESVPITIVTVAMKCLAWMNCRNVEAVDLPAYEVKLPRKPQAKVRPRLTVICKTLQLTKEFQRQYEQRTGEKVPRRLHMMRGHFRDYRPPNKPLFGKIEGRFWIPQRIRGDKKAGAVLKNYAIGGGRQ